jgi:hypothetical protein
MIVYFCLKIKNIDKCKKNYSPCYILENFSFKKTYAGTPFNAP